ncbi:MAG TPA: GNAT family N-acetyltransferase [Candidatus Dormibacteraeota bacterium]|nr:GNAT family N-acetyltransferase [Candidatus Dormibacteraeota bacterium]
MPGTPFSIRPVKTEELKPWLDLANQFRHWQEDVPGFLFEETLRPVDEPRLRLGAWTTEGVLAGTAEAAVGEDGERWIDRSRGFVVVAPAYRRQGLGARLADEVERFAARAAVRWLETETREPELAAARPLLQKRGFKELERYQTSRQKPSTVDLRTLDQLRSRLRAGGIETVALPDIDGQHTRQELYRCNTAIWRDMPHEAHVDWEDPPLETFTRSIFERPSVLLESFFVARDGDHIVGLSYLLRRPDGDAEVGDTGVLRSHRRRGIARVLKLLVTSYAAQHGISSVHTDNRADNAGMLAINRELGFKPGEVMVVLEKTMTAVPAI